MGVLAKFFRSVVRGGAWLCGFAALAALLLRLTVYDDIPTPWQVLAYVTPLPVVLVLLLPPWFVFRGRISHVFLALIVSVIAWWMGASWKIGTNPVVPSDKKAFSFLYWTADHFAFQKPDQAADWLKPQQADLMIMGEGVVDYGRQVAAFKRVFPEYEQLILPGGYWMLHKAKVLAQKSRWLAPIIRPDPPPGTKPRRYHWPPARAHLTVVDLLDPVAGEFTVVLLDHFSTPTMDRAPAMRELTEEMRWITKEKKRVILAGDFNTPSDSRYLRNLRGLMTNAFEQAGKGTAATWPAGFPVLALDQVWSSGWEPIECQHTFSSLAGHESVRTIFQGFPEHKKND
jgi:vancomycin resistance protein VanJ